MKDLGNSQYNIDAVKNYWNTRPCNIRHSNLEFGTKEYFNEVENRKYFVEPHILAFADFKKWAGKKVLEVGCGIGTDAINFARAGAIYTGTDLSNESVEITRNRFKIFSCDGILFDSNFENLPHNLEGKQFDLIYSFGVIHHSPNPRIIIENMRKVISENGELRIMLYSKISWKSIMIQAGLDQPEAQYGCPIAFSYTEDDVKELLKDQFEIIEISKDHIFQYNVDKYKNFGWHMLITAKPI